MTLISQSRILVIFQGTIPNRVSIIKRPEMIRQIAEIGNLEGDLTLKGGDLTYKKFYL